MVHFENICITCTSTLDSRKSVKCFGKRISVLRSVSKYRIQYTILGTQNHLLKSESDANGCLLPQSTRSTDSTRPYAQECKGFSSKHFKEYLLSHVNNGLCTESTDPAVCIDHSKLFIESVCGMQSRWTLRFAICHLPSQTAHLHFVSGAIREGCDAFMSIYKLPCPHV